MRHFGDFKAAHRSVRGDLRQYGAHVEHQKWQGIDLSDRDEQWDHWELMSAGFIMPMPQTVGEALDSIQPNLPWAEEHFQERIGGKPLNPGDQYKNWPHWRPESEQVLEDGKFTHTYMERFWPKRAGDVTIRAIDDAIVRSLEDPTTAGEMQGIRYRYGDLNDVVNQLLVDPLTRQAYLPIFFPEDTGAVHGGRVPCTLGYHFMLRGGKLHLWYEIRSCDFLRHFRDDIYMAVRLAQWMLSELKSKSITAAEVEVGREYSTDEVRAIESSQAWHDAELGNLTFLAHSMHIFMGDRHAL